MVKTKKKASVTESPFTVNLGIERRKKLFEKALKESTIKRRTVTIAEIVRAAIDRDLQNAK